MTIKDIIRENRRIEQYQKFDDDALSVSFALLGFDAPAFESDEYSKFTLGEAYSTIDVARDNISRIATPEFVAYLAEDPERYEKYGMTHNDFQKIVSISRIVAAQNKYSSDDSTSLIYNSNRIAVAGSLVSILFMPLILGWFVSAILCAVSLLFFGSKKFSLGYRALYFWNVTNLGNVKDYISDDYLPNYNRRDKKYNISFAQVRQDAQGGQSLRLSEIFNTIKEEV